MTEISKSAHAAPAMSASISSMNGSGMNRSNATEEIWWRVVRAKDQNDRRTGPPALVSKRFSWTTSNGGGWLSTRLPGPAGFEGSTFYGVGFDDEQRASPVDAARARAWKEGWRLTPAEAVEAEMAKATGDVNAALRALELAEDYAKQVKALVALGLKAREDAMAEWRKAQGGQP